LAKACTLLASPINKNIFVVRLGRKLKKIDGLRQALNVSGNFIITISKPFAKKKSKMKNISSRLTAISFVLFASYLIVSCKNNSSSTKIIADSTVSEVNNSNNKANQLFSEGMKILDERISIQSSDKEKAMELNKKAIEKFSAAYRADSTLADPVLFASECTMYAKDYQNCIYWTSKLIKLDTTQRNQLFCIDRIAYCNKQLKSGQ